MAGAFFLGDGYGRAPPWNPVKFVDISSTLSVDDILHAFVEQELLPGTGVAPDA